MPKTPTKRTKAQIAAEKKYQATTTKVSYFRKVEPEHVEPLDKKLEGLRGAGKDLNGDEK